jgi:hypothetical protein
MKALIAILTTIMLKKIAELENLVHIIFFELDLKFPLLCL